MLTQQSVGEVWSTNDHERCWMIVILGPFSSSMNFILLHDGKVALAPKRAAPWEVKR